MKKYRILIGLLIVIFSNILAQDFQSYIFPDPQSKIVLVTAAQNSADILTGEAVPDTSSFYRKIMSQLNYPFHQSVIKLNQCTRNFSGDTDGPNVLFLSTNEGGFPRKGIKIMAGENEHIFAGLNFVDLVLDERRIERGDLDIFSHELGHVMMNNIWKNFGQYSEGRRSPKQHVSMGVTDYFTAFSEGWGEHFQRFANQVELYENSFEQKFEPSRFTGSLWHSNVDQRLRIDATLYNDYIFEKLIPSGMNPDSLSLEELILLEHTSDAFDRTRLKNGQEMLSCEGFISTFFYNLNSNEVIRNNWQNVEFYNRFLVKPIKDSLEAQKIFTPYENVMLKNFFVWDKLSRMDFTSKTPLIEFIYKWIEIFPEDKSELLKLFTALTAGVTFTNEMKPVFEKMSYYGLVGDIQMFREMSGIYFKLFVDFLQKLKNDEIRLDANLGPELWTENEKIMIKNTLWGNSRQLLRINLNTAGIYELAAFYSIDLDKAKEILERRNKAYFFKTIKDVL